MMMCTAALLLTVGCKKEEPRNNGGSGSGSGGEQPQQRDLREGAYDPVCKIVGINCNDGSVPETWLWEGGRLTSVNDDDMCGGYTERIGFTYRADGRVDNVAVSNLSLGDVLPGMQVSGTMRVSYSGDYISGIAVENGGTQVLTAQVQHNSSNKVSGATLGLDNEILLDLFNMMLAQFLNDSTGSGNAATEVDNVSGQVAFSWQGNNVSQARLNVGFRVASTVGTLVDLVGEDNLGMFGTYGQYLTLLPGNQPLYFTIAVGDTVDYTYDNRVNPFKNYLGRVHISCLSENNMNMEVHNGSIGVVISTSLFGSMIQLYQTSYALPIDNRYCEYPSYNNAGCPTLMVDQDGYETVFQYME